MHLRALARFQPRYSMLVKDGKVVKLNVEGPGKFEVSARSRFSLKPKGNLYFKRQTHISGRGLTAATA